MIQYIRCLEASVYCGLPNRHVGSLMQTVRKEIEEYNPQHFILLLSEVGAKLILHKNEVRTGMVLMSCIDHEGVHEARIYVWDGEYLSQTVYDQAKEYAERYL